MMNFDPYYQWLGIQPKDQPPNYYRLLGVEDYESNLDVIAASADRQMGHIRSYQSGKHSELSQKLLNEIAAARVCLLNTDKKDEYDASLQVKVTAPIIISSSVKKHRLSQVPIFITGAVVIAVLIVMVFLINHKESEESLSTSHIVSKPLKVVESKLNNKLPADVLPNEIEPADVLPNEIEPADVLPNEIELADVLPNEIYDEVYLSDLTPKFKKVYWFYNSTKKPIGGQLYDKAILVHPIFQTFEASIIYSIDGQYDIFIGAVGINDEAFDIASPQSFQVFGDEKELWKSTPLEKTGKGDCFQIDISNVNTLELRVVCLKKERKSWHGAHVVWINPQLLKLQKTKNSTESVVLTKIPPEAIEFQGSKYLFVKSKFITWTDAKKACENIGGQLAITDTDEKIKFLRKMANGDVRFWVGGNKHDDGKWRWLNGPIIPNENIKWDEPKCFGLVLRGADEFVGRTNIGWSNKHEKIHYILGYICEWRNQ